MANNWAEQIFSLTSVLLVRKGTIANRPESISIVNVLLYMYKKVAVCEFQQHLVIALRAGLCW
jgi:hypothetical protein